MTESPAAGATNRDGQPARGEPNAFDGVAKLDQPAQNRAIDRREPMSALRIQRNANRGRSRFGNWHLDRRNRRLSDSSGRPVSLTKGEYALLVAFLDAPQRPLSREHLLQATRIHEDISDRSIDVQVLRLRRKLECDSSAPRVIVTERGVGYVFALPVETL